MQSSILSSQEAVFILDNKKGQRQQIQFFPFLCLNLGIEIVHGSQFVSANCSSSCFFPFHFLGGWGWLFFLLTDISVFYQII